MASPGKTPLLLLAALAFSWPAAAQQPTAAGARVEQALRSRADVTLRDNARHQMDRQVENDVPASPGDPDLGEQVLLKRQDKATPFTVQADVSGFFTNNAALTDLQRVDDYFMIAQAGVSYQPRLTGALFGELSVRQAFFRYAEFSELDFDSLNVGGGLTYVVRQLGNTAFSMRYNYNRLTDGAEHQEFFRNHTLSLSALKTFELSKAHYLYAGYATIFGWGDPVAAQRDEHGVFAGYRVQLARAFSADLYYRFALFDYVNGRDDWNQNLALALRYNVTRWFSLTASTSLGWNQSNRDVFDYEVFNAGVGLAGSISF